MKIEVKVFIGIMIAILVVCSGIQIANNARLDYYVKQCESVSAYTGIKFVGIYDGDPDNLYAWMDTACNAGGDNIEWSVIKEDGNLWIIACIVNPRTRNEVKYLMAWV